MQKRAPTLANILVICLFALSCFGLLLFLWGAFGGSIPLKPKGYRFTVAFPRTLTLAQEANVRISGVDVGHVVKLKLDDDGRTHVTVEMNHQYAPLHSDVHAVLRQKTLLGETYIQIIPGSKSARALPDGAQLANSQVEGSTTLDDVLSALDPQTRRAFQEWMQSSAAGLNGRGEDFNALFATFEPFIEHTNKLVGALASQEGAVTAFVHNTGVVFDALGERDHQFQGLIENGERTFHATAQSSQAFADAFRAFPVFERNSRTALRSLDSFATDASPLLDQLKPTERQLAPLARTINTFAPDFNKLLTGVGPLTAASKRGLPAVKRELDLTVPILGNLSPFLHNFNPFLQYLSEYVPEIQAFFANITAASQGVTQEGGSTGPRLHYLRVMNVVHPESLAVLPQRTGSNRANPYAHSGASRALEGGSLPVFSSSSCSNPVPTVSGPANSETSQDLIDLLVELGYVKAKGDSSAVPVPGCSQQGPFTFNGHTSQFPQVTASAK